MALKCSVLGHAYGETTVDRDREEQGSEVVITIREVETCDRCGTERVVSENKEVTAIETPDDEVDLNTDEESNDETTDDGSSAIPVGDSGAGSADDAGDGNDIPVGSGATADGSAGAQATENEAHDNEELSASEIVDAEDGESAPTADPDEDTGAEIIDAAADTPVDGDDPADASGAVDDELADPSVDVEMDDSGSSEEPTAPDEEDDAVIIDGDDESETATGRQPGEWPEEPARDPDAWKPDTIGAATEEDDEAEQATEATTLTVPDGQFRCPECDFTTLVESSSLRRGDFCPDCRRGTLVHEPKEETRKE